MFQKFQKISYGYKSFFSKKINSFWNFEIFFIEQGWMQDLESKL